MLQLSLNSDSSLPLVDQIVGGIRSHIDDRMLRTGSADRAANMLAFAAAALQLLEQALDSAPAP